MTKRDIPQSVFDSPSAIRAARLGHAEACAELARLDQRMLGEGNPNHPSQETLFGYGRDEFMRKQYKESV